MQTTDNKATIASIESLNEALNSRTFLRVRRMLGDLPVSDIAHLLESSPPRERQILWALVEKEIEGEVVQYLSEDVRTQFLSKMDAQQLIAITENFDDDDFADLLQELPDTVTREVLQSLDTQDRRRIEAVLSYPEDTAGGLMDTNVITIRPDITLDTVLRYLRRHESIPAMTDSLLVVNRKGEFIGILEISKLLVSDPNSTVREVMNTSIEGIPAITSARDVATLFERRDLVSAPVTDDDNKLLGRITIDDVVDVIREEADHSLLGMAGLGEDEDTFAPIFRSAKRRAVWLAINLLTAFMASAVIGLFQVTINKVVALAILMPIVASMGGIAGSQTLTLIIRGMALGHIAKSNVRWLLIRELCVGTINGLLWALVIALATTIWFQDIIIGVVIALAIIINLITAGIMGAALPVILRSLKIDPALAGSVILTTITDIVGFFAFLGLATLFYA